MLGTEGTPSKATQAALQRAIQQLEQSLARTPDAPALLVLRARAAARSEGPEEAAHWWERAAAAHAGSEGEADCQRQAALAWSEVGALEPARRAWASLLRCDPCPAHQLLVAEWYLANDLAMDALPLLEAVASSEEHAVAGRACDLLVSCSGEPLSWARRGVEHAAHAKEPDAFGARLVQLARLHLAAGDRRKAEAYLERARPYLGDGEVSLATLE